MEFKHVDTGTFLGSLRRAGFKSRQQRANMSRSSVPCFKNQAAVLEEEAFHSERHKIKRGKQFGTQAVLSSVLTLAFRVAKLPSIILLAIYDNIR